MITKWKDINYISCWLAHKMVVFSCNVCVVEKKVKKNYHIWVQFPIWLHPYCTKYDIISHVFQEIKLWKSWKTWKITKKSSMHGKIMEFEKKPCIIMVKSWNFVKQFDETLSSQKTSCRTPVCPTASFLATGGFKF